MDLRDRAIFNNSPNNSFSTADLNNKTHSRLDWQEGDPLSLVHGMDSAPLWMVIPHKNNRKQDIKSRNWKFCIQWTYQNIIIIMI